MRGLILAIIFSLIKSVSAGVTVMGDTSHPGNSIFIQNERVDLTSLVKDLASTIENESIEILIKDIDGKIVARRTLSVDPDSHGSWQCSLSAPSGLLGYYHVTAKLSSGEGLIQRGSREAGYLSYIVVVDPKTRLKLKEEEARMGLQGGFPSGADIRPLLGVDWVMSEVNWQLDEPDHSGQYKERHSAGAVQPPIAEDYTAIVPIFCLIHGGPPQWARKVRDGKMLKGVIGDLDGWRRYCAEVAQTIYREYPLLNSHLFQVTWEPCAPWNFDGDEQDLVAIYKVAFEALHAFDPKAKVIGPTGLGVATNDIAWNERLLSAGLANYIDGYSVHPYVAGPPEQHALAAGLRALKQAIRRHSGRDLPIFGTEQGFSTKGRQGEELQQAVWLTRTYLITLGEGVEKNMAFYACDFPSEPGYGFMHNLVIAKEPWKPSVVSPKPVAAAFSALTSALNGFRSLGPIDGLPPTAVGYAFRRNDAVVLALWDPTEKGSRLLLRQGAARLKILDWMGNAVTQSSEGQGGLQLNDFPIYLCGGTELLSAIGDAKYQRNVGSPSQK